MDAAGERPAAGARGRCGWPRRRRMLALGMGAEAEALATSPQTEDARAAEAPDAPGLAAVAALLAGRLGRGRRPSTTRA